MLRMLKKTIEKSTVDQAAETTNDPWLRLANGIILQAVKDYRMARKALEGTDWGYLMIGEPKKKQNKIMREKSRQEEKKESCRQFFLSEWIMVLTDIDGEAILNHLERENIIETEEGEV